MKYLLKTVSDRLLNKGYDERYSTPATRQYFFRYER